MQEFLAKKRTLSEIEENPITNLPLPPELLALTKEYPQLVTYESYGLCQHTPVNMIAAIMIHLNHASYEKEARKMLQKPQALLEPPLFVLENVPLSIEPDDGQLQDLAITAERILWKQYPGAISGIVIQGPYAGLIVKPYAGLEDDLSFAVVNRIFNSSNAANPPHKPYGMIKFRAPPQSNYPMPFYPKEMAAIIRQRYDEIVIESGASSTGELFQFMCAKAGIAISDSFTTIRWKEPELPQQI